MLIISELIQIEWWIKKRVIILIVFDICIQSITDPIHIIPSNTKLIYLGLNVSNRRLFHMFCWPPTNICRHRKFLNLSSLYSLLEIRNLFIISAVHYKFCLFLYTPLRYIIFYILEINKQIVFFMVKGKSNLW